MFPRTWHYVVASTELRPIFGKIRERCHLKLCTFILANGSQCQAPARNASRAGLCRFHDRDQKRAGVIARAQADKARTPARLAARAQEKFVTKLLRERQIPMLLDYASINQAFDNIIHLYEHEIFDIRTTRVMLRCLRIVSTNLRNTTYADNRANAAVRTEFRAKLLEATRNLQLDAKYKTFQRLAQLQAEENQAQPASPFPADIRHSPPESPRSGVTGLDSWG